MNAPIADVRELQEKKTTGEVRSVAFSADGSTLVCGGKAGHLCCGKLPQPIMDPEPDPLRNKLYPSGHLMRMDYREVAGGRGLMLKGERTVSGEEDYTVRSVAFGSSASIFGCGVECKVRGEAEFGKVELRSAATLNVEWEARHQGAVVSVALRSGLGAGHDLIVVAAEAKRITFHSRWRKSLISL